MKQTQFIHLVFYGIITFLFALVDVSTVNAQTSDPIKSATATITRLIGTRISDVTLNVIPSQAERDSFTYQASGGKIIVSGSTGVAICRGFYEYLKKNQLAQVSWTGNRLALPTVLPDAALTTGCTPYKYRYYFNVVTYGYTMPYWDSARWQQEIDWMAFHGVNMPLMLVGVEAIAAKVWGQIGLTQSEINASVTGPAHLPWQRMGNIANVDGSLSANWHTAQTTLAHQLLTQMRELGMKPIVQGFSGFVPKALTRVYTDATLYETNWGGFPTVNHAYMLAPNSTYFASIQKKYIEEWEKEYGVCDFYLIDSFNEMELPKTGQPDSVLLADYGEQIYKSLEAANPNATWVIQGWMLGSARGIWTEANVRGLLKKIPDDKIYILDEACDYNANWWYNGTNWEKYSAYNNKQWGWGVIPNMGGKTAYTGVMSFYATEPARALSSNKRGRLNGFGMCPEGIENNDVLYELLSDVAWTRKAVSLDTWLPNYAINRYGAYPKGVSDAWTLLRRTVYSSFYDHPRFAWQSLSSTGEGTVHKNPQFINAVKQFLSSSDVLGSNKQYEADAIEMTALCMGLKADEFFRIAIAENTAGHTVLRDSAMARTLRVLYDMDHLLESHPLNRLSRWLDFAKAYGTTTAEKRQYESNARKIVTTWGAPSCWDYSARMWSGLIRDYYRKRLLSYFNALKNKTNFDRTTFENNWVAATGISTLAPYADPIAMAKTFFDQYSLLPPMDAYGIAFLKPVTASSIESGALPEYITDGETTGKYWGASPYSQNVVIDLESLANIDSIRVYPYVDGTRYYRYTIAVSADKVKWTTVGNFSTNTAVSTVAGTLTTISPAVQGRYVKVIMSYNSANVGVHLHEVRVFGKFQDKTNAINTIQSSNEVSLYAHGKNIYVQVNEPKANVFVYSVDGKLLMKKEIVSGSNKLSVNFLAGVYLVKVQVGNTLVSKRIMIE